MLNHAVAGLYFYSAVDQMSTRNELYLNNKLLDVNYWADASHSMILGQ